MGDMTSLSGLTEFAGNSIYAFQALAAVWGAFCVIVVWRRLSQARFRNDDEQDEFMGQIEDQLAAGNFDGVAELCEPDGRVLPQLALLAVANRDLGYSKIRQLVADRFQRDVLSDLDHRMTWIVTVIKAAPMLGLLGTVLGMMAAFSKIAGKTPDPTTLASDISLALITTFVGLTIAVPLSFCVASIQIRTRKMEEAVAEGLTRFLETFKAVAEQPAAGVR